MQYLRLYIIKYWNWKGIVCGLVWCTSRYFMGGTKEEHIILHHLAICRPKLEPMTWRIQSRYIARQAFAFIGRLVLKESVQTSSLVP